MRKRSHLYIVGAFLVPLRHTCRVIGGCIRGVATQGIWPTIHYSCCNYSHKGEKKALGNTFQEKVNNKVQVLG